MKKLMLLSVMVFSTACLAETENVPQCRPCNATQGRNQGFNTNNCCEGFNVNATTCDTLCHGSRDGEIHVRVRRTTCPCPPPVTEENASQEKMDSPVEPMDPPVGVSCACVRVTLDPGSHCEVVKEWCPQGPQGNTANPVVFCFDGIAAGKHTIVAEQDCPHCKKEVCVTVDQPDPLKIKCITATCSHTGNSGPDGTALIEVCGGTPPYCICVVKKGENCPSQGMPGPNSCNTNDCGICGTHQSPVNPCTQPFDTLPVDTYKACVTDYNGCTTEKCFEIDCCPVTTDCCDKDKERHSAKTGALVAKAKAKAKKRNRQR